MYIYDIYWLDESNIYGYMKNNFLKEIEYEELKTFY